jgi:DNA-binding SARP family transcriptional activator/DNA-binding CsgD family transcriptional regulator
VGQVAQAVMLDVRLLGPLGAVRTDTGAQLELGGPRQRAVLALLVLAHGDVVPAERLADSLWGDAPPVNAAGALQAYVSHLRRRLEPDRGARSRASVIVSEGAGYALRLSEDAVDAWRFERMLAAASGSSPADAVQLLRDALDLWRGAPLAEYTGEAWADAAAARLTELRDVAREQLLAARLDAGEAAVLIPELTALVSDDPLREERWRLLALALYRANRQADALAALRRARSTLTDELGVEPGPALRRLEAEVLAQAPELDAPPRVLPRQRSVPDAPPVPTPAPDGLVDREREMAELGRLVADATAGAGRVALMEGPAGIGKTRLLGEVRRLASAVGVQTLMARGSQMEREFGFGAVRQLFEPALVDPSRRAQLLQGAAASAASVFDAVPAQDRADGTFAVLHGLYWLTVNLSAQQPLVLAVDDLQWCDAGSLRFLAYLARRLDGLPVLVAATLRTGEEHAEPELLSELAHDFSTVPVRPTPLTPVGVGELVRGRLGSKADDTFVRACHRTTNGNPLLLRQLLRALEAEGVIPDASHADTVTAIGSRAVSSIVLMRLNRMPASAKTAARAIAVLGDGAALPTVAALAGLPEPEAAAAIADLSRAEVLRDELPLGFVHPLVRDAVYRDVPPGERELQHERAARALHATAAAPEQVAAHLLQVPCRGDAWVVEVLRAAAARAADRGAADSAATYLGRALEEPPSPDVRPQVLVELGTVEARGDGPAASVHLAEAYAALDDPAQRATVALLLAQVLVFVGDPGEATSFARSARAELPEQLVDERQGLLACERVSGFMHGIDPAVWRVGAPTVSGDGIGARMLAAVVSWEHELELTGLSREQCAELARSSLDGGVLQRVDPGLFWVIAAIVLDVADQDVAQFWDDALAAAYARGSLLAALATTLWRGRSQWQRGHLREAEQSISEAIEQSERFAAAAVGAQYGEAFLVEVLVERGSLAAARALYDRAVSRPRYGDAFRLFAEAQLPLLLAEQRWADALAASDATEPLLAYVRNPIWRPWLSHRAEALAGLGLRDEAEELYRQDLALLRQWGAPRAIGKLLRQLGSLTGDETTLREAVAVLAGSTGRLEHARAQAALAAVVPAAEAVPLLRAALEVAETSGADSFRAEVADALAQQGISVPEPQPGAVPLTTTERRVLQLHADGHDSRAIAQALFLTPRTVERTLADLQSRA